jgi:hypothetical protein
VHGHDLESELYNHYLQDEKVIEINHRRPLQEIFGRNAQIQKKKYA